MRHTDMQIFPFQQQASRLQKLNILYQLLTMRGNEGDAAISEIRLLDGTK
jgi:hypothetical protein